MSGFMIGVVETVLLEGVVLVCCQEGGFDENVTYNFAFCPQEHWVVPLVPEIDSNDKMAGVTHANDPFARGIVFTSPT